MKTNKIIFKYCICLLLAAITITHAAFAQESKEEKKAVPQAAVESMINSKHYVFIASSMSPTGGKTRQLTSYYDVKVKGDTIVSYLPYFGRAYTAPINSSGGGIDFTSTSFDYIITPRKKGGWDIKIKFKDQSDVREMDFTVYDNGRADVFVTSNSRQSVSFSGMVTDKQ